MQITEKIGKNAGDVGHDEVLVRAHQSRNVDENPVFARAQRERVHEEVPHLLVGPKEMMPTQRAAGDQDGGSWANDAWLCHARASSNRRTGRGASERLGVMDEKWRRLAAGV
ncbi:hypothetical protein [Sandaracinus amylolyticus]|uniref:hypothetical protein n=1 Tax=Sandaracinus amylolyticus TaxID=927083 RepID=UPI002E2FBC09|nr:hypothetical protein [Sandaracinus amylolyticus]